MERFGLASILTHRKIIPAVNLLLGMLIIIVTLFFIRDILSLFVVQKEKSARPETKPQTSAHLNLQDYATILKNNPFGFAGGELTPITESAGPSAAQTDLSLLGTVAGRKDISYAIIANKSGQQEVYKIGANVFGVGTLRAVEKDKVILSRNGTALVIPLAEVVPAKETAGGNIPSPVSVFGRKIGESSYQIDQQRIQQALDKPDQLMTDARFIPHIIDGKPQGFVLREMKPGGIYDSLGLQNGDILLRINDFAISTPENSLQAFSSLRGIDRIQLDIIRNSARTTLTYQIR